MKIGGLKFWAAVAGAAMLANAGGVWAQASEAKAPSASVLPRADGYLGKDRIPNSIKILPPPPALGSLGAQQDAEVYLKTRALAGTERWAMATRDAVQYIQAFDCPLGFKLENAPPEVLKLLGRVGRDASSITNLAKDHFERPRPFIAPGGAICTESDRAGLMKSYGYPSGHATFSWAVGLILAELVPDRATDILARARAFGESRVVCGVHSVSDITEGRTNGASLVAVLHADPSFRADMDAARVALKAAMDAPHAAMDAGQCKVEADAELHTPWVNPTGDK